MSKNDPRDRERMHHLMMAALDGECTPEERAELDAALTEDAPLRKEWERMTRVKEVTSGVALREPPAEVWDEYWEDVYRRNERKFAWILTSIGATILIAFGIVELFREILVDPSVPWAVKGAFLLLVLGGSALVVSVVREKVFTRRRDPYREVQR